jgi:hypothetical protein
MTKTLYIALLLILVNAFNGLSQVTFNHSFGGFYTKGANYDYRIDTAKYTANLSGIGVVYSPRLNLFEIGRSSSFSVGTNIGLGYKFTATQGATGSPLVIDLPLMFNFNTGAASTFDNAQGFGWFLGLGVGYSKIGESIKFYNGSMGPIANFGIRLNLNENFFESRASYMVDVNQAEVNVFTLSFAYILGMNTDY